MKGSLSLTMRMTTCIYAWWQESRMTVLGLPVNFLRKTSQIMNLEVFRVFSKDGIYGIYTVTARADALLTLLWSLSYPCQHYELSSVLYRWTSALSHSINDILEDILYCRLNQKLSNRHATSWMDLDEYCSTIKSKDWYLLGIYRQDMHVYMQTNGRATGHVLWSQVPTLPEIPECDGIIRADSKSFWPNWRISTWYFRGEWTPGAARWGEI